MTYELAKKLKDSGFPIKLKLRDSWHGEIIYFGGDVNEEGVRLHFTAPTLSELIEACGKDFYSISRINDEPTFECASRGSLEIYKFGKTPEEAVANLWLEINKNSNA